MKFTDILEPMTLKLKTDFNNVVKNELNRLGYVVTKSSCTVSDLDFGLDYFMVEHHWIKGKIEASRSGKRWKATIYFKNKPFESFNFESLDVFDVKFRRSADKLMKK